MRLTSARTVAELFLGATVVSWLLVRLLDSRGLSVTGVSWLVDAALLALTVLVLWLGLGVRAYLKGRRPRLDGLRAARTLVLAKAATLTGSLLAGWYLGQVLALLPDLGIEARRSDALSAAVATACAVLLAVVGLVVERWCRLPPGDDDEETSAGEPGQPA